MTEWEPATDAEVAMRNALRTDDQESYFRILAGVDLLLPVSADALAGLAPLGWGTWSTGGRTHVLAFTSPSALQACLAEYTGSARRVAYAELAETWPNLEWWLAVNPGLPIEGYLPAWFVAQLSRGDLRLPTRGPGREGSNAPNRIQDLHAAATLAATAAAQGYAAANQPGGPIADEPMSPAAAYPGSGSPGYGASAPSSPAGYGASAPSSPAGYGASAPSSPAGYGASASGSPAGYGAAASGGPAGFDAAGGLPTSGRSGPAPVSASPDFSTSGSAPAGTPAASIGDAPPAGQVGPGGLPLRTPGAVLPSGLPSRVPGTPPGSGGQGGGIPGGQFNGFGVSDHSGQPGSTAAQGGAPGMQPGGAGTQPGGFSGGPGGSQVRPGAEAPVPGGIAGDVPAAYRPPTVPPGETGSGAARPPVPSALDALAARTSGGSGALNTLGGRDASAGPGAGSDTPLPRPDSPLPTRTPMAQTPPLPAHIPPPSDVEDDRPVGGSGRPAQGENGAARDSGGLPKRQMTSPAERPPSMAAAAQALAGSRGPASATSQSPAATQQPGLPPPVIPGAGGAGRSPAGSSVPASAARPALPPPPSGPAPAAAEEAGSDEIAFTAASEVERDLLHAVEEGSTDSFLSTLLLATVLVPVAHHSRPGSAPGESGFAFRTEEIDGERFLVVFTSRDRLAEHFAEPTRTVGVRFVDLIRNWPDPAWSFAVNPTSVIGARYPGPQVIALASWAVEAGLGGDPADAPAEPIAAPQPRPTEPSAELTTMQKAVPAEQVDYYLDRGYDRVAGFVHRAGEVEHLHTPGELFAALGLLYDGSPYQADAKEAFVLRWPAHRPSLYRIPYGGQSEQALRAMDGWVIERPPFRGNGFAPGEGKDVIAEFKVDSVRLPHGTQLWRMDADGDERMIAIFDCDEPVWRRVGEQ